MQRHRTASITALAGLTCLTGCSLVGTWCPVKVKPEEARFPIASLTLVDDETYCVTSTSGDRTGTTSGTYEWTGLKLILRREDGPARVFPGHLRLDGKLVLTHEDAGGTTTGVLEKQANEKTGTLP